MEGKHKKNKWFEIGDKIYLRKQYSGNVLVAEGSKITVNLIIKITTTTRKWEGTTSVKQNKDRMNEWMIKREGKGKKFYLLYYFS